MTIIFVIKFVEAEYDYGSRLRKRMPIKHERNNEKKTTTTTAKMCAIDTEMIDLTSTNKSQNKLIMKMNILKQMIWARAFFRLNLRACVLAYICRCNGEKKDGYSS